MSGPVKIRMYNVGFGDAFLMEIPAAGRPRRVLVDCGMHSSGPGPLPMKQVVRRIVDDVRDAADGVPRIDVVVCTHRHQDHVSGFQNALWKDVEVGEVWMPWTEDPKDRVARRIRDAQSQRAQALMLALGRLGADEGLLGMAQNALTNAAAMKTLHQGFRNVQQRRFLPTRNKAERSFTTPRLPDVEVHVLGPSRDKDVIRDMEPAKGESYLQFLLSRAGDGPARVRPFRHEWALSAEAYHRAFGHLLLGDRDRRALEGVGCGSEFELLSNLEKAVNGTSLMLMFVVGRAHLLFVGDAQWGSWTAALADPEWKELLAKTTFYKVGHHASHNATPPAFVQALARRFSAMASTRHIDKWPDIPRKPLLEALREKSACVVRSDRQDVPDPPAVRREECFVETTVPV